MSTAPHVEYRILMTGEEKRRYSDNFNSIEGMEERKQRVLEECRRAKEERREATRT